MKNSELQRDIIFNEIENALKDIIKNSTHVSYDRTLIIADYKGCKVEISIK